MVVLSTFFPGDVTVLSTVVLILVVKTPRRPAAMLALATNVTVFLSARGLGVPPTLPRFPFHVVGGSPDTSVLRTTVSAERRRAPLMFTAPIACPPPCGDLLRRLQLPAIAAATRAP
eukprot:TRINITY_DN34252_c0_g1_i1.p3 TRINITY_DN34252_c0_g1~~TRINITY_DN34252_c0_g1_i1.p3  ORF type:complete len:117 (+),score=8.09 TRINITY_DN34252_c0_g1_i1:175-525(+)